MGLGFADPLEAHPRETQLRRGDHGIDAAQAVTLLGRVTVGRGLDKGLADESAAAPAVGLVPGGEIAVDEGCRVGHGLLLPVFGLAERRPRRS